MSSSPTPSPNNNNNKIITARRIYTISDIHTDHQRNFLWIKSLHPTLHQSDVIIVAGDVSHDVDLLLKTLGILQSKFRWVFFTPGNHDLWLVDDGGDDEEAKMNNSLEKLRSLLRICHDKGVIIGPRLVRIGTGCAQEEEEVAATASAATAASAAAPPPSMWIIPILSWYHSSFDTEPEITEITIPPPERVMSDYKLCKWPKGWDPSTDSVAEGVDAWNDDITSFCLTGNDNNSFYSWSDMLHRMECGTEEEQTAHILSFSHFLPRLELCPEKRMLFYPNLTKAVGSAFLRSRVDRLSAVTSATTSSIQSNIGQQSTKKHVHIFGHTHFGWDHTLDNTRYIQAALSYPREWENRPQSLRVGPDATGMGFDLVHGEEQMSPLCIFNGDVDDDGVVAGGGRGGFAKEMSASWSDHYKEKGRDPQNTELAPWVKDYLGGSRMRKKR